MSPSHILPAGYEISTDLARLDLDAIHRFLNEDSYWAGGIPRDVVQRAVENSLCFGLYQGKALAGLARVITDKATFALVADVFVLESHRGQGLSKCLMQSVMTHPDLQGLRRHLLLTADAHGLYSQFGFQPLGVPGRFMEILRADIYRAA
jgi:GNAT superfamily N-acetyltransferase